MIAAKTSKAKLGNTRKTGKEQFYTPAALAQALTESVAGLIPDFSARCVVEPAGGNGAFVIAAQRYGAKVIAFDIEPKHKAVQKQDFLTAQVPTESAITLSNPPFGRNNSLSIPFFNKAAEFSDYICFVVPRSWRKWSVINRLDRRFHLINDQDLKIDYVDDYGYPLSKKLALNTCFQIWQKRDELRPLLKVIDNRFIEKVAPQEADVALTVFGYGCGTVHENFERKPNSTRMFLKLGHPESLAALKSADFSRFSRNTAYTEALSLQEINFLLNQQILGDPQLQELP